MSSLWCFRKPTSLPPNRWPSASATCLSADEEVPHLSISIGVATFPKCGVTVQQLLEFADRALYARKEKLKRGKNGKEQ